MKKSIEVLSDSNTTLNNIDDQLDTLLDEVTEEFFNTTPSSTVPVQLPSRQENSSFLKTWIDFVIALTNGSFYFTNMLIKEKNLFKEMQRIGKTKELLYQMIKFGNLEACKYLIKIEKNYYELVNQQNKLLRDEAYKTVGYLSYAIIKNQFYIADYFLENNIFNGDIANFNEKHSMSLLFFLISTSNLKGCKYLLKRKLENYQLIDGNERLNALMFAINYNQLAIANYLMSMNTSKMITYVQNWFFSEQDEEDGKIYTSHYSFPFYLLEKKDNPVSLETFFYLFDKKIFSINLKNDRGLSLLMIALILGRLDIANGLLEREVDLHYIKTWRTSIGMPFLSFLIVQGTEEATNSCKWLFQHISFENLKYEKKGFDPLSLAITNNSFEVATLLIKNNLINKKWITLTRYIKSGNLSACKLIIEHNLCQINEKDTQLAMTLNYLEILELLKKPVEKQQEQLKTQFDKVHDFFQKLLKENSPIISGIIPIINYRLCIEFNRSHTDYLRLIEQIKKYSSYFILNGKPPKSFTISTAQINSGDLEIIQSVFQLEPKKNKPDQIKVHINYESPEPFYASSTIKKPVKHTSPVKHSTISKTTNTISYAKGKEHKPKTKHTHSHTKINKKTSTSIVKTSIKNFQKEVIEIPPKREIPKAPKVSPLELKAVQNHMGTKMTREYPLAPLKSTNLQTNKTLSFYYKMDLQEQTQILKQITISAEKVAQLKELIDLAKKIQNQIENPVQTHTIKQAFLYDFFFLLELIQQTFNLINHINDMFPLSDIKKLRQLMKTFVFNYRKQNVNLTNLMREAEKICNQLHYLNNVLQAQTKEIINIKQLEIITHNLGTQENQVTYPYNSYFFQNVDMEAPISKIHFINVSTYVEEFLHHMKVIENNLKTVKEKSTALSAAKWCIIGLDKQQKIFEKTVGKSDRLKDLFLLIHVARNQLSHSKEDKESNTMRNRIIDEEVILDLKDSMLELQELIEKTDIKEKWTSMLGADKTIPHSDWSCQI